MTFNFSCNACNGNLKLIRRRDPQAVVIVCGACRARYYVTTGPDRHALRYLGNLDPVSSPASRCEVIPVVMIGAWERDGGRQIGLASISEVKEAPVLVNAQAELN
jgi:hypothetical protein